MKNKQQELQDQIQKFKKFVHTDSYPIGIGEVANMYLNKELDIHPEFQRIFRWTPEQKSKFIESILLGLPIPSFFVAQREDGVWDVIDGLQRLATIFQFMSILKDENNEKIEPLRLTTVKYLKALENVEWNSSNKENELSNAYKLYIKRAKLDFKIILAESDITAKYELFQRLNTGGAELQPQEIRNAMLVGSNPKMSEWLDMLSQEDSFSNCLSLSERNIMEQYDKEQVLRFIILRKKEEEEISKIGDINDFLTDQMQILSTIFDTFKEEEERIFKKTFNFIYSKVGNNAFKKFVVEKDKFLGGFSISAFECVALGVGYNIDTLTEDFELENAIKSIWNNSVFTNNSGSGVRASTRIPNIIPLGRRVFCT